MRHVERVMGTAVSIDVRQPVDPAAIADAVAWLHWVDRTFSVYRADSQVSRIGRSELDPDDADPEVREVLTCCDALRALTEGWFDHRPADRPDRPLDPSGYVKGWALEGAALRLRLAGATRFCINGGGDLVCAGGPEPGRPWRAGVRHPDRADAVAAVLAATDCAVATSGRYERGDHVWAGRPLTTAPTHHAPTGPTHHAPATALTHALRSVTVVGPDLGVADALATALLAADDPCPGWVPAGYDVLAVTAGDELLWTAGLDDRLLAPPAQPSAASTASSRSS